MKVMSPIHFGARTWYGRTLVSAFLLTALLHVLPASAQEGTWTDVFNGKDLTGLKKHGNGTISVVAATSLIDVDGGNGYLYTDAEYTHYRARIEWKNIGGGNCGYLHHIDLAKHACGDWPSGPELQMMQGDVGSIWTTDCKFNSTGTGTNFNETGAALTGVGQYGCGRTHFVRKDNKEKAGEWNTWEIFVKGDSLEIKVNGSAVLRLSKLTMGGNVAMIKGRMGLQIEGAHVQWRNWQVMDLTLPTNITAKRTKTAALRVNRGDFRFAPASGVYFGVDAKASGSSIATVADAAGRSLSIAP
jgi:hypothetical protein